jgi:hypothetical protein
MPPWLRSAVAIKCTSGAKNRVQILLIKFSWKHSNSVLKSRLTMHLCMWFICDKWRQT